MDRQQCRYANGAISLTGIGGSTTSDEHIGIYVTNGGDSFNRLWQYYAQWHRWPAAAVSTPAYMPTMRRLPPSVRPDYTERTGRQQLTGKLLGFCIYNGGKAYTTGSGFLS